MGSSAYALLRPLIASRRRWSVRIVTRDGSSELVARYQAPCGGWMTLSVSGVDVACASAGRVRLRLSGPGAFSAAVGDLVAVDEAMAAGRELTRSLAEGQTLQLGRRPVRRGRRAAPCPA